MSSSRDLLIRELLRQTERQRELLNNPAVRAAQELQTKYGYVLDLINKLDSPALRIIREMQDRQSRLQTLTTIPAFSAARDSLLSNATALRYFEAQTLNPLLNIQRHRNDLLAASNWTTAKAISEFRDFIDSNYSHHFYQSFLAEALNRLPTIEDSSDEESIREFIAQVANFLEFIIEKCKDLPKNPISYLGMLNFVLSIFFVWYQLNEGAKSEERITDSINQAKAEIVREVEKLKPDQVDAVFYVVERKAKLVSQPKPKSAVIQILSPNQKVRLIKTKGKWIYVEYFDYVDSIPRTGWLLKKYAKRIAVSDADKNVDIDNLRERASALRKVDSLRESILSKYEEMPDSTELVREDRSR